jgi:CRISPR-associated protein Csx14
MPQGTNGIAAMELSAVGNDKARSDFKRATTMSSVQPNICLNVDVTNPGQFFACCGLLELADRLWPGAEVIGCFSAPRFHRSRFTISAQVALSSSDLIKRLVDCKRNVEEPYQPIRDSTRKPVKDVNKIKPVLFQGEEFSLRLAWWLDELTGTQTRFKTWSARNRADELIEDAIRAIKADEITDENLLQQRVGMTSRLGLDPRSSWNTLDTGFSPNEQSMPVDTYPATELLAAVGLEMFRPSPADGGYIYAIWSHPLPATVARAAASGKLEIQGITRYRFEVASRGEFKYFTQASLLERREHG